MEDAYLLILFTRTILLYALVFLVIRLIGKRQISDLQPFDLIMTLLIADLASEPASDVSIPLLYGVVPILALFLLQRLVAFLALKNTRLRKLICGSPLILIKDGIVQCDALYGARYTVSDLIEQLRTKDVFDLSDVSYAILETNGSLSVLLKGGKQQPDCEAFSLPPADDIPPYLILLEGQVYPYALQQAGFNEIWLKRQLARLGSDRPSDYLYALLAGTTLYVQTIGEKSRVRQLDITGGKA